MAADDRLNEIAGPEAKQSIVELRDLVKGLTEDIVTLARTAKGIELNLKGASTLKEVVTVSSELQRANERLLAGYDNLKAQRNGSTDSSIAGATKYERLLQAQIKTEQQLIRLQTDRTKVTQRQTQENNIAESSLKKLSATLDQHRKSYYLLTQAERENEQIGGVLRNRIQELDSQLKLADSSLGKFQRNVGNYGSALGGLRMSVQQVAREMPSFANSVQTGFMAISNNLPILIDSLQAMRAQNAALRAEGKPTQNVLKALAGSVFNWQTALIIGITALTVYGKEIGVWAKSLFNGREELDKLKASADGLNKAFESTEYQKAIKSVSELRLNLDLAKQGFIDKEKVVRLYNSTIGETAGQVSTLDEVEASLVKNADAYVKMTLYKAAANQALEESAKKLVEAEKIRSNDERDQLNLFEKGALAIGAGGFSFDVLRKRREEAARVADEAAKGQEDIARKFLARAAQISAQYKFDIFGGGLDDKTGKPKAQGGTKHPKVQREEDATKDMLRQLREQSENEAATQQTISRDNSLSLEERLDAYDKYTLNLLNAIGVRGVLEQQSEETIQTARNKIVEKAAQERKKIEDDAARQNLAGINTGGGGTQTRSQYEQEWRDRQTIIDRYADAANSTLQGIGQLQSIATEKRLKEFDDEIAKIEERKQAEIDYVNGTLLSQEQKAKKISEINAKAKAEEDELNQKRREEQRKNAAIQKAITIASIIAETALAVVRALSDPTVPNAYVRIANGVAVGALGAAQLAVAVATPLPGFADGTEDSPEGLAMVGERGKELVIHPDGTGYITPDKATVTYLPKHSQVITNEELMKISKHYALGLPMLIPQKPAQFDTTRIEKGLADVKQAIKQIPQTEFGIQNGELTHIVKNGQVRMGRLNNLKF